MPFALTRKRFAPARLFNFNFQLKLQPEPSRLLPERYGWYSGTTFWMASLNTKTFPAACGGMAQLPLGQETRPDVFGSPSSAELPRLDRLPQIATFCDMPTMTLRVDRQKVKAAKKILAGMGLTPRTAIDAFLAKVVSQKAIPFPLSMPDSEYAIVEYNMTPAELAFFDRRMDRMVAAEKKAGTIRRVTSIASLRA